MKKDIAISLLASFIVLVMGGVVWAFTTWALNGTGTNHNTPVVQADNNGNLTANGNVTSLSGIVPPTISTGTAPASAGLLIQSANNDIWISTGTGTAAWVKVGGP